MDADHRGRRLGHLRGHDAGRDGRRHPVARARSRRPSGSTTDRRCPSSEPAPQRLVRDGARLMFAIAVRHWRDVPRSSLPLYAVLDRRSRTRVADVRTGSVDPTTVPPSEVVAAGIAAVVAGLAIAAARQRLRLPGDARRALARRLGRRLRRRASRRTGIVRRALDRAFDAVGAFVLTVVASLVRVRSRSASSRSASRSWRRRTPAFAVLIVRARSDGDPVPCTSSSGSSLAVPVVMREGRGPHRRAAPVVGARRAARGGGCSGSLLVAGIARAAQRVVSSGSFIGADSSIDFLVGVGVSGDRRAASRSCCTASHRGVGVRERASRGRRAHRTSPRPSARADAPATGADDAGSVADRERTA